MGTRHGSIRQTYNSTSQEARPHAERELAKSLGVPLSTYKEWEYGRRIQGEGIYVGLAEALGVSLRALLTGQFENEENDVLEKIELAIKNLEGAKKALLSSL